MAWKRPVIIATLAGVSVALVAGLAMASIGAPGPVPRPVALMLALLVALVIVVGFGAFVILSGDLTRSQRDARARRALPGLRPAPSPHAPQPPDGLCMHCGAALSYPPLVHPVKGPCGVCGYPITDVRGARCPECGAPLHKLHIRHQEAIARAAQQTDRSTLRP